MGSCKQCGGPTQAEFRFCPWCSEPQRSKLVEFFRAHASIASDRGKALRVSRYLEEGRERHVRFSVWNDEGIAEAAVSLDDRETERLARFLLAPRRLARRTRALRQLLHR